MLSIVIPLVVVVPVFLIVQEFRGLAVRAHVTRRDRRASRLRVLAYAFVAAAGGALAMLSL